MANDMKSATKVPMWAVLIGIDDYKGSDNLEGCVRDVATVEDYLELNPSVKKTVFVARKPSSEPSSSTAQLPTYQNITEHLAKVTEDAAADDNVLIYFSGHGSRTCERSAVADLEGNLALVVRLPYAPWKKYLRGEVLADRLKKMVDKGLFVTLILDCCYSGSILRDTQIGGANVKSLDYDPELDPGPGSFNDETTCSVGDALRTAEDDNEWLVSPQGYTVLAACEPHCEADEIEVVTTGEKRGALTHFLFETIGDLVQHAITDSVGTDSAATIYQYLCAKFQEKHPEQMPMLYGRQDLPLLGGTLRDLRASDSLQRVHWVENNLVLNAGQMHGVRPGDQYVILPPFEASKEHTCPSALVQSTISDVSTVRFLTSTFGIAGKSLCPIKSGWVAKANHRAPPGRLLDVVVPRDLASSLRATLERTDSLRISSQQPTAAKFHVHVKLNERANYEILDARHNAIPTLPQVQYASVDAGSELSNVLHHISTLKFIESLESPLNSRFESLFTMEATSETSDTPIPQGFTEHLKKWTLHFHNRSSHTLYIAIFNLNSFWEVANVSRSDRAKGDHLPVQPGGSKQRKMTMKVPPFLLKRGLKTCVDVIKVFVTSRPTQFSFMLLGEISSHIDDSDRSSSDNEQNLLTLLRQLEALEPDDRAKDLFPEEGWACRNFVVRTFASNLRMMFITLLEQEAIEPGVG